MSPELRQRLVAERRARGWSIREASRHGATSNTTWGRLEAGEIDLTPRTIQAVADAFGWPNDWPDNPPDPVSPLVRDALADEVEALQQVVRALAAAVGLLLTDAGEDVADELGPELRSVIAAAT